MSAPAIATLAREIDDRAGGFGAPAGPLARTLSP